MERWSSSSESGGFFSADTGFFCGGCWSLFGAPWGCASFAGGAGGFGSGACAAAVRPSATVIAKTAALRDRKSTRLNSSHTVISYAVFCLKKKKNTAQTRKSTAHTTTHSKNRNKQHKHAPRSNKQL